MYKRFSRLPGFTMIELLVVIAIIGILAVATLSTINPIEQINKGRDTRLRTNASELLAGIDRFYSVNEKFPWNKASINTNLNEDQDPEEAFPDANTCANIMGENAEVGAGMCKIGGTDYDRGSNAWLTALATTQEVKTAFVNQLENSGSNDGVYLLKDSGADLYICFKPLSNQFRMEAFDACNKRKGVIPPAACPQNAQSYSGAYNYLGELICLP